MRKYKAKWISALLILILVLQSFGEPVLAEQTNAASALAVKIPAETEPSDRSAAEEDQKKQIQISEEAQGQTFNEEENVRIIVELQGEPVIEEAIRRGISYAELSDKTVEKLEQRIEVEQTAALEDLADIVAEAKETSTENRSEEIIRYNTGFNGLAMTVKAENIEAIEKKSYVKKVYIAEEFERPQMKTSHSLIGSSFAWDTLGLKGEGTVVAIIDTGIDYTHSAMTLGEDTHVKYDRSEINRIIRENGLRGKYFTDKVPYGYNYYDHNTNTFDSYGVMHGMHVAGTVGANKENGAEISGVAPNAQLLALKVFSDDIRYPTTFTDIWLKAVDDAIALKADVINMSLGAPAGMVYAPNTRPEEEAFRRARSAGIVVAVSAGNDGNIMTGNHYQEKALAINPDTALIASPTLFESTISVASVENSFRHVTNLRFTSVSGTEEKARINIRMGLNDGRVVTGSAVHIGFGEEEDYKNQTVRDKIILLSLASDPKHDSDGHGADHATAAAIETFDDHDHDHKHTMTLEERIRLAESKDPRAILLYNDLTGGESVGRDLNTLYPLFRKTLAVVGYSGGQKILEELKKNPDLELTLSSIPEVEPSPNDGKISAFSSWGPTPDLRIKPEVAAPGGNIYSTAEENGYKNMSGTSMASPHVAGAAAILKQQLRGSGLQGEALAEEIKLRLMNTAEPVTDKEGNIELVRRQGAGLIRLDKALKSQVFVKATGTNDQRADGKLELGELSDSRFEAVLHLRNDSAVPKTYRLSVTGVHEKTENGRLLGVPENLPEFGGLREQITIPAHSGESLSFRIDFSQYTQIRKESFLEGYIQLKEITTDTENAVDLVVPFLAFYGDWGKPSAIDALEIKERNLSTVRSPQFIVNKNVNSYSSGFVTPIGLALPIKRDTLYFVPDLEKKMADNNYERFGIRMAPLRNMSKIEYSILDEATGKTVKVLGESTDVRKLNRLALRNPFVYMPESIWNGELNGEQVKDEDAFIYQIKATLNNHSTAPQTQIYQYRLKADTHSPELADNEVDKIRIEDYKGIRKKVSFKVKDAGVGLERLYLQSVHFKKRETDENGEHKVGTPEEVGTNPDITVWKPFYGKSLKIHFLQAGEQNNSGQPTLRVENGKLTVPESYLPNNPAAKAVVYCDINGHETKEIEVETYYDADESYLLLSPVDFLGRITYKYLPTGSDPKYIVDFFNYYDNIKPNKGKIWINDEEITDSTVLTSGTSKIRIEFPEKNAKLKFLKVMINGEGEVLVKNGKVVDGASPKYQLTIQEHRYEFTIENKVGQVEVYTEVELPGYHLSFAGVDFHGFTGEKIQLSSGGLFPVTVSKDSESIHFPKDETVNIVGQMSDPDKKVDVILKQAQKSYNTFVPEAIDYEDYESLDNAYLISGGRLFIKLKMTDEAMLTIRFREDSGSWPFDDFLDGTENGQKPMNKKYPAIFLRTPNLLEIKSGKDEKDKMIALEGFVGYVGKEGLESLTISLVDADGNLVANPIPYPLDHLEEKEIRYAAQGNILYQGIGYEFALQVESPGFLTNIRIEAVAKNGKSGSITRRMYFDSQMPNLVYSVESRGLEDEFMNLHIQARDDSFHVRLYQNGSYLGGMDLSKQSLRSEAVSYSESWQIPLKVGQNRIELKVVDVAGKEKTKVLYVYRALSK